MKKFDVDSWARKPSYEVFRNYADPSFHITAKVDVTRLYNDCKINGDSFFLASLYYMTRVANEILEFRLRIIDGEVWEIDHMDAGTIISHGGGMITFASFAYKETYKEFMEVATKHLQEHLQRKEHDGDAFRKDVLQNSVLPWVSFTAVKHPHRDLSDADIPKVTCGKLIKAEGKVWMPVNIEAHHGLMDGYQMSRYFQLLEEYCA